MKIDYYYRQIGSIWENGGQIDHLTHITDKSV